MTLLTSLQKRFIIVITLLTLFGSGIHAKTPKKFTIDGKVVDENGDGVKKAEITVLFDGESKLKKPEEFIEKIIKKK